MPVHASKMPGAACALLLAATWSAHAQSVPDAWLTPQEPVRLFGNTYYVGTRGLASILIVSDEGHVLIDGGMLESAPVIAENIIKLGFKLRDVRAILHSHAHYDHVGGLAELQRLTGAVVYSSKSGAKALRQGRGGPDDPQFESGDAFHAVEKVREIRDGQTLQVGLVAITGHYTPGHTPGGMSWTWNSCEKRNCANLVYADSVTPVSDDGFRYSGDARYPRAAADFRRSFYVISNLSCDILITPHPEASNMWERLAARDAGQRDALVDTGACRAYADRGRRLLDERLARERANEGE
jgi:metallo-beta-lactamase class B